jgi:hypothetical protein
MALRCDDDSLKEWEVLEIRDHVGRYFCRRLEPAIPPATETLDGAHLKKASPARASDPYVAGRPLLYCLGRPNGVDHDEGPFPCAVTFMIVWRWAVAIGDSTV